MKRSVAIRGPTPMFVRWAIELPCPLREVYTERLPETTFRQLRAVRELSLGQQQGRIRAGFCLHPSNQVDLPKEALGFSVDEVVDLFGGIAAVDGHCRGCRANAGLDLDENFWAGCFGIVSADLRWNLDNIIRGELASAADNSVVPFTALVNAEQSEFPIETVEISAFDLPQIVNAVSAQRTPDKLSLLNEADIPVWVRLWRERVPSSDQLLLLEQNLERTLEFLDSTFSASSRESTAQPSEVIDPSMTRDLKQFFYAVQRCRIHEIPLHVELVPAGFSDGLNWRLHPHCQNCKQSWPLRSQPCSNCGPNGRYQNEIKLKVLGLRPYLRLVDTIGLEATTQILERI